MTRPPTSGYSGSAGNLARTSPATNMVVRNCASLEPTTVASDVTSGMTATLTVAV